MFEGQVSDPSVYSDFTALARLKQQSRQDDSAALEEVARQFESIFLSMVMKGMRNASIEGGLFESTQTEFYEDLYDKQLSATLSRDGGIGLAELIVKQLTHGKGSALRDEISQVDESHQTGNVYSGVTTANVSPQINSKESFFKLLRPVAENVSQETGFPAEILLAQSALETGWGKSVIRYPNGASSNNLFGIKADNRWQGKTVLSSTLEYADGVAVRKNEKFRAYSSYRDSMIDYVDFIRNNARYQEALKSLSEPDRYFDLIHQAGYATDPEYTSKIKKILVSDVRDQLSIPLKMSDAGPLI